MKTAALSLALFASLFLMTTRALAQSEYFHDGTGLYKTCTSSDVALVNHCLGYIVGVVDTLWVMDWSTKHTGVRTCVPAGARADRLKDIVVRFLASTSDDLHLPAAALANAALAQAFPCR
jgi:hypothetical protein